MQKVTSSLILHWEHIGSRLIGCDLYLVVDNGRFVESSIFKLYTLRLIISSLMKHSLHIVCDDIVQLTIPDHRLLEAACLMLSTIQLSVQLFVLTTCYGSKL